MRTAFADRVIDLEAEWREALAAMTDAHRAMLRAAGVPENLLTTWPMCGVARVVRDGLFEPNADRTPAIITPVRVADPWTPETPMPEAAVRLADIVDHVCWHPRRPIALATRCGTATWIGAIEPQLLGPDPVPIHRSVLNWLRARAEGLVLLDPARHVAGPILLTCRSLLAEDEAHRDALIDTLRQPCTMPTIAVATGSGRRAA